MSQIEVMKYISQAESEILSNAVKRIENYDLGNAAQQVDFWIKNGNFKEAIRAQWRMVGALSRATVHLEKQNLLMEADYERRGRGRNSDKNKLK
jgi:hypothetical protein